MDPLRQQYEQFPYPPLGPSGLFSTLALPRSDQGEELRYETGTRRFFGTARSHHGKRILVAGAGTFETLVVAQMHPAAREIVALDFSAHSLGILKKRIFLARPARRIRHPFRKAFPPIRLIHADLDDWQEGAFDFIFASNILHHLPTPAATLERLSHQLTPDGILRLVTYPKASRLWMRETGRWLQAHGITPKMEPRRLCRNAARLIRTLSDNDPVRLTFETHPEIGHPAGLIDAFLNARENPLCPLEWRDACQKAGLELIGEAQNETSRSDFLIEICPKTHVLDAWTRLQILDDLLELCANPVLWLRKQRPGEEIEKTKPTSLPTLHIQQQAHDCIVRKPLRIPHYLKDELARNIKNAERLLASANISLSEVLDALRNQVGPRVSPPPENRELPGLSIIDYDLSEITN